MTDDIVDISAFKLNRKSFIDGRIAVDALPESAKLFAFPGGVLVDVIKEDVVEKIWKEIEEEPIEFVVDSSGVLSLKGYWEPKIRADFYDLGENSFITKDRAIASAIDIQPVMWVLESWYEHFLYDLLEQVEDIEDSEEREVAEDTIKGEWPEELDSDVETLQKWFTRISDAEFEKIRKGMIDWLEDEPDYGFEDDYLIHAPSGESWAVKFFRDHMTQDLLDILGVKVVEGEFPGSTYFAAELSIDFADANRQAERCKIPIRFESDGRDE